MNRRQTSFGTRGGGGRREQERVPAALPAQLVGLKERHRALLLEISTVGARVRAENPPKKGSEVFLLVQDLDVFAKIVWKVGEVCGLRFDQEIRAWDVELLKNEAAKANSSRFTAQQKGGADDWNSGVAR